MFSASHLLHFASPILQLSNNENGITTNPDNMTPVKFIELMVFYNDYNWSEYDSSDFPTWLYMPESYPTELNQTDNEPISPFWSYDWDNYNKDDFPSWILAPNELNSTFIELKDQMESEEGTTGYLGLYFMMTYIDPEYLEQIENYMENPESTELSGSMSELASIIPLSTMFILSDAIWLVIWLVVGIILFILSGRVD